MALRRYTSAAVEELCAAITSEHCRLSDLRIFGNCWGNKDSHKLAAALRGLPNTDAGLQEARSWRDEGGAELTQLASGHGARNRELRCAIRRARAHAL